MAHFNEDKTNLEILLDEKMKNEGFVLYDENLEIDEEDFIEIKIEESKEVPGGNKLFTKQELPPKFGRWISSRPKLLFSLFKQRRFKAIKNELRAVREILRYEFGPE